jgi:hypothetical protein
MADAAAAAPDAPHHPTAGTFLIAFKAAAIAYYVLCGWLPIPFTVNFCVVAFLLVLDFWTVRALARHRVARARRARLRPPPDPTPASRTRRSRTSPAA